MKGSQVFSVFVSVLVLAGTLLVSGCGRSGQALPGRDLPADLQAIAKTSPGGEGAMLYEIPQLFSAVSLAVSDSGIYAVVNDGGSSVWRAEGKTSWIALGGTRSLRGLATGGDGRVVYAWGFDGVWRLKSGEGGWQHIGGPSGEVEALAAGADGEVVYAKVNDGVWQWQEEETAWQRLELDKTFEEEFGYESQLETTLAVGPGVVYAVASTEIYDSRGSPAGWAADLLSWAGESGWQALSWDMGNVLVERLAVSGDGADVFALTSDGSFWARARQWPINQELIDFGITMFLYDPQQPGVLYVGTKKGLFLTTNSGLDWELVGGTGQGRAVNAMVYHPRWQVPLVATDNGVFFVILRQQQQRGVIAEASDAVAQFYDANHNNAWFWPITVLGGFLSTYVLGMAALLLLAWRGGSTIFSRTWLNSIAAKPLLITPGLGRWALFLGYKRRLEKLRALAQASKDYFGLPAEDSAGSIVLPDPTGDALHERISEALGPQQPVLIIGKGGAGKSTLLARWAFLALKGQLPSPLKGFRPVLIPASYYGGKLIKAAADTLRERDGVAIDEEIMQAQMQSGKLLILFDGITEVETDKQLSLQEILRTARDADFQGCRFLIAARPLEGIPAEVPAFHLRSLTSDVISVLLPRYRLGVERESRVRRQLHSFGEKPLEPLLFIMALAQSNAEQVSTNRAQLYERYFRRLLRVEGDETLWLGWRAALETIAQWFLLNTGRRGIGLPHELLIDLIAGKANGAQAAENLVALLQRYYHLPVKDELDLLKQLEAAGLLQGRRRWHFVHDTFEEYYAASCMVSRFDQEERWPNLDKWLESHEREQEFLNVMDFVREMTDEPTRQRILKLDLPVSWKECLNQENKPQMK